MAAAAAALAVIGAYSVLSDLFLRDRTRVSERVDYEFLKQQREQARKSPLFKNLSQVAAEALADDENNSSVRKRFQAMVDQSGLNLTSRRLLGMAVIAGGAVGSAAGFLRGSILVGALGGLVGFLLPIWFVHIKRNARLERLRSQLPDAFDLMARVIRAGQTLQQALQAVADEFPMPIAGEFAYCYEQQNLGLAPELTLRDLNRRTGLIELKIFVLAVLIQQQTGGNLSELLGKLAHIVRERYRIRGTIRTLTAEGRLQGTILLVLPVLMFFAMLVLNPSYAWVLMDYPNLIIATLVCEALGALWIRKIVNFDF
jgi:tight adherence protein B